MVSPCACGRSQRRSNGGYTLIELMMSTAIFSTVCAALLMAFVSLQRSYAATKDFAINHADQMRISDYLALDLRRAIAVQAAQNDTTLYIPAYYTPRLSGQQETSRDARDPVIDGNRGIFYGPTAQATITTPLAAPSATPNATFADYALSGPATLTATASGGSIMNGSAVGDTVLVKNQTNKAWNGLYAVTIAGNAWKLTAHAVKIRYYLSGSAIYRNEEGEPNQPVALATDVQDFIFDVIDPPLSKVIKTTITFKPTFRSAGASSQVRMATAFHNTTLLRNNRGVY